MPVPVHLSFSVTFNNRPGFALLTQTIVNKVRLDNQIQHAVHLPTFVISITFKCQVGLSPVKTVPPLAIQRG